MSTIAHPEESLVASLKARDKEIIGVIYDRYAPALYGVIVRIIGSEATAEIVLHDTFLSIWKLAGAYDASRESLSAWLINIARNAALDHLRSKGYKRQMPAKGDLLLQHGEEQDAATPGIREMFEKLGSNRQLIDLVYFHGASEDEAAEALNISPEVVKTQVSDAIRQVGSLEDYARAHSKKPPWYLRSKILNELYGISAERPAGGAEVIKMQSEMAGPPGEMQSGRARWLAGAALTLLALSGLLNVLLLKSLHEADGRIVQLQGLLNSAGAQQQQSAMASGSSSIVVQMMGVEKQPDALASVTWDAETKEVFLTITSLQPPPEGKQYILWTMSDGQVMHLGVLEAANAVQKMKSAERAGTFFITLEQHGGGSTPALDQICLIGSI